MAINFDLLISGCNTRCRHCYVNGGPGPMMPAELALLCIEKLDTLAALLKMGRTKFYGKMKEFTGMSPNNYLQTERLKKAAELLIEGDLNVTEVSYKVGFQSPTYFYKCFKEKYGVPPSKFGRQKKD